MIPFNRQSDLGDKNNNESFDMRMSQLLINDYLKQFDLVKKISGSSRETRVSVETERVTQAMKAAAR